MKLGNRGLLCDCENHLIEASPYCDDCHHKDPSVRLIPSVSIDPSSNIDYISDPSNTYIGTNKVYEFPQKKYKMLSKEITKNKCNNIIEKDLRGKFRDPNILYEREYYNPRYLKLKYGDIYANNKENFYNNYNTTNTNIIIIIIVIIILLLFILLK
jgi:hypothetical protein